MIKIIDFCSRNGAVDSHVKLKRPANWIWGQDPFSNGRNYRGIITITARHRTRLHALGKNNRNPLRFLWDRISGIIKFLHLLLLVAGAITVFFFYYDNKGPLVIAKVVVILKKWKTLELFMLFLQELTKDLLKILKFLFPYLVDFSFDLLRFSFDLLRFVQAIAEAFIRYIFRK